MRNFDPAHRSFVSYIDRTREYYRAQGYDTPYAWAHNSDAPFRRLAKPLSEMRIALVTTASPVVADEETRPAKSVWSGDAATPPNALYTDDLAWDKEATHTRDTGSFLPIAAAQRAAAAGRIAGLTPRFHGVPTEYSQRRTVTRDAPEILERLRQDGADAAVLVPL
jgi:hypothetical protein